MLFGNEEEERKKIEIREHINPKDHNLLSLLAEQNNWCFYLG